MSNKKVTLAFCKGSNSGQAFYLSQLETDSNGEESGTGYRVAGGKCWGFIKDVKSYDLSVRDLKRLIEEAQSGIDFLEGGK